MHKATHGLLTSRASSASICARDASGIRLSGWSSQEMLRAVSVSFSASSRRRGCSSGPLLLLAVGSGVGAAAAAAGGGLLPAALLLPLLWLPAAAQTIQGRPAAALSPLSLQLASAGCSRHNRGASATAMVLTAVVLQFAYVSWRRQHVPLVAAAAARLAPPLPCSAAHHVLPPASAMAAIVLHCAALSEPGTNLINAEAWVQPSEAVISA